MESCAVGELLACGPPARFADSVAPLPPGSMALDLRYAIVASRHTRLERLSPRPTRATLPQAGTKPLAPSLDTVGVLAHSVDDAAFFVGVLSRNSKLAKASQRPASPVRVAVCHTPEPAPIPAPLWTKPRERYRAQEPLYVTLSCRTHASG